MCWTSVTPLRRSAEVRLRSCLALLALLLGLCAGAARADPVALAELLSQARSRATAPCNKTDTAAQTLVRVLCAGELRVGVRGDYPPFGSSTGGQPPAGFEVDLAQAWASRLGLQARLVTVLPANRMAMLGEGRVDVLIAATGHTLLRDGQATFVQPHYYQSRTVVVGRRDLALAGLPDLAGKTVCVTVGNATNADLAGHGARLMLFADAHQMIEQLHTGSCVLAAQDDSLFARHWLQDSFRARQSLKFGFAPLPWGAAVDKAGGADLARALGLAMQDLHADGSVLQLAQRRGIAAEFLQAQQQRWSQPPCADGAALDNPACRTAPYDNHLEPTSFAQGVDRFEQGLGACCGVHITLPMLKTRIALDLFLQGVGYSLALVLGAVLATVAFGLVLAAGLADRRRWLRWPARGLLMCMQSTPLVLLMIFAGVLGSALGAHSPTLALALAVTVLGLFNGSNAGQAIAEARASLRLEGGDAGLRQAVQRARAQVVAFVVNATRGSPAASLIGVPELLSAQTDIASFSTDRATTFALLLVFYMALVSAVVWLGNRWQATAAARGLQGRSRA